MRLQIFIVAFAMLLATPGIAVSQVPQSFLAPTCASLMELAKEPAGEQTSRALARQLQDYGCKPRAAAPAENKSILVRSFKLGPIADADREWFQDQHMEKHFADVMNRQNWNVQCSFSICKVPARTRYIIEGEIEKNGEDYHIEVRLTDKDKEIGSTEINSSIGLLKRAYRSMPEAILAAMRLQPTSGGFRALGGRARSTNTAALAAFIQAKAELSADRVDEANALLEQATTLDTRFADAFWTRGAILIRSGKEYEGKLLEVKADALDPDHLKDAPAASPEYPLPSLMLASAKSEWRELSPGLQIRQFRTDGYGVTVTAWAIDPETHEIDVATSDEVFGATALAMRAVSRGILAMNAGFFEMDSDKRLTPSGLFITKGLSIRPKPVTGAGSGIFATDSRHVFIEKSENYSPSPGITGAFQSGPLVVDPGGKNGIVRNDTNRLNRGAACIAGTKLILVVVEGGLSLYEFGALLSSPAASGGFGCERAINLDGGPSTQASFALGQDSVEIEGQWKAQSFIIVH